MKTLIVIAIAVVGLLVAFVSGIILTSRQNNKLLKLYWFANLELSSQQANEAYFNEDPSVAVWALKQNIRQHEQAGQHGAHDILGTDMPLFLTISHTRIARLYRQMGNQRGFSHHIDIALAYAKQKSPNTSQSDLLESVAKFDEIQKESYKEEESQQPDAVQSEGASSD